MKRISGAVAVVLVASLAFINISYSNENYSPVNNFHFSKMYKSGGDNLNPYLNYDYFGLQGLVSPYSYFGKYITNKVTGTKSGHGLGYCWSCL
jgi:hypothetical protein